MMNTDHTEVLESKDGRRYGVGWGIRPAIYYKMRGRQIWIMINVNIKLLKGGDFILWYFSA